MEALIYNFDLEVYYFHKFLEAPTVTTYKYKYERHVKRKG
jgi:hypothetical protein